MALDEKRLESLAIEWIIGQVRERRRMKDTLPIEGAMFVPLEWAESLANAYAPMATEDTRPAYDDLAAVLRIVSDELRRTVDEDGRIIHQNRVNDIYRLLQRVHGFDYWETHPISDETPKVVLRHISGD